MIYKAININDINEMVKWTGDNIEEVTSFITNDKANFTFNYNPGLKTITVFLTSKDTNAVYKSLIEINDCIIKKEDRIIVVSSKMLNDDYFYFKRVDEHTEE